MAVSRKTAGRLVSSRRLQHQLEEEKKNSFCLYVFSAFCAISASASLNFSSRHLWLTGGGISPPDESADCSIRLLDGCMLAALAGLSLREGEMQHCSIQIFKIRFLGIHIFTYFSPGCFDIYIFFEEHSIDWEEINEALGCRFFPSSVTSFPEYGFLAASSIPAKTTGLIYLFIFT